MYATGPQRDIFLAPRCCRDKHQALPYLYLVPRHDGVHGLGVTDI